MDQDNAELIGMLCTRIGSIMEDASVIALTIGAIEPGQRLARLVELKRASATIASLFAAVETLS